MGQMIFDIIVLVLLIPLSAIVLGIGSGIVQLVLKSSERRMELRLKAQKAQSGDAGKQIELLRAEIAALRDTTTQYDMTNDQIVQRLEERLSRIEAKTAGQSARLEEDTRQRIGRG
jgi:TolA-binding protein